MAKYTIASGKVAVHDKTLAANVVDSVTFTDDPEGIEIVSDGAAAIYFTTDGTEPTVSGQNTFIVPAYACARTVGHGGDKPVKLISSGTPKYSVSVA